MKETIKKHSIRKIFIILFTLCILPVSSVMLMNASAAIPSESAKPDMISVTYQFDETEILNWLDTKQSTKDLRVLSLPGEPLALYRVANILLPPYNEVADVSVVEKIGGQHIVRDIPCGQPPAIIGEEPTIVGKNANIYNSDELYPNEIYRVGSVKSFRGYKILNVRLYPVQYKPASKRALYYKEMTVKVKLKEGPTMDTLRNLDKGHEAVETLVDNPSILSTYDSTLDTADSTLITTETLGTTYEYIIVTTPDLADEFQVLANWKANFVDGAKVVTVNENATDTEIKNVINDYYTNYNTSYVLLGGDVDVITNHTKMVYVPLYDLTAYIAEDYWFANLVGDDDISYYEVYIGRAPVDNSTEATNFVNKVIAYEQMDKPKANLFHQSRCDYDNNPDSRQLAWQCEQYVPADYVDYELFQENGRIEKNDWINFWRNDGIMCEHIGHGSQTFYYINYELGGGKVRWYNTDVANMDNTFWPVHTSVACFSGAFEYEYADCLAEVYVKDPDNGAIACLFNDKEGWYDSRDATMYSGDFVEMQFKALYQDGWTSIGAMLAHSKNYFIYEASSDPVWEWCFREINLLGDPETPLLTKRIPTVNVVKNSGWETGDNSFWNVSTIQEPYSSVDYEVTQDSACNGTYGFHVSMETNSSQPLYTTQSLMESQSLNHAMLDTNTKLKYRIYPAYELYEVSEIPEARWEIILSFSTGNKLHYYSSLNMEPTENSTDQYVYMPITLSQWNRFFDKKVLETYTSNFGTPPIGTVITKIAAFVTSETYANNTDEFNRVIANFDSDEDTEGLQCTIWYVKNVDTGLNYTSIQEAIDASETLDGHTISVMGPFYEYVVVNKSLTLIGEDPSTTIIDGNGTGDVVTVQSDAVTISQFTIQNGKLGIRLEYSDGASISDNVISDNWDCGMYLYNCVNSTVSSNTVTDNRYWAGGNGILIDNWQSNDSIGNNVVTDNIASGNSQNGIWVFHSDDNLIKNNTAKDNDDNGIYLYASRYNEIAENWVINNGWRGINLYGSIDNVIHHNNFIDNRENAQCGYPYPNIWWDDSAGEGNYWSDYTGQDSDGDGIGDTPYVIDAGNQDDYPLMHPWGSIRNVDTGLIYPAIQKAIDDFWTWTGHTIKVETGTYYENVDVDKSLTLMGDCSNATIIDGSGTGSVVTVRANNVQISQFTIQNGETGVYLYSSNYGTINNNALSSNTYGILATASSGNDIISGNTMSNNTHGVYLQSVSETTISGNTMSNNSNGTTLFGSNGNTISDNIIGGNNTGSGIYLDDSSNNSLSGNEVSQRSYGIQVRSSSNDNIITGNTMLNNTYGIHLLNSSNNAIYHNRFINNTNQAASPGATNLWDDGYPGGGNCWSDYNGTDLYSGPYQNETGTDGIGDTPYIIDENNRDNYLLMQPWKLIKNVNTGLIYSTIEEAIDALETSPGDTIKVYVGTYEQLVVRKSVTIKGIHPSTAIIFESESASFDIGVQLFASNTTVTGFTVRKFSRSFVLFGVKENVSGNVLEDFGGIKSSYGIYVTDVSHSNTISNNDMTDSEGRIGIFLDCSDNNVVSGNKIIDKWSALFMCDSHNNTIKNNNFSYCSSGHTTSGMDMSESNNNTISGNTITNNGHVGIYLHGLNNSVSDNIISDNEGVGICVGGNDNIVKDNTITNNGHVLNGEGIFLGSSNNTISGNTIFNNSIGISLNANNNLIYHNNFIDNTNQIEVSQGRTSVWDDGYPSGGNYWSDYEETYPNATELAGSGIWNTTYEINDINNDTYPLVHPWGSIRNVDTDKIYLTIQKAINALETEDGHTIEVKAETYYENVVVNKSLTLKGEDQSTTIIDAEETGNVLTVQANNVNIEGFMIQNGEYGIYLDECNYSTVSGNWMLDNTRGIYLFKSDNNTITENRISNNSHGIYLYQSEDNVIHHNNFIDNNKQRKIIGSANNEWNSTNLVGNYWSDYNGTDTDGDGIGDTFLPHQGVDWYPLMWKWFPGDLDGDGDVDWFDYGNFSAAYGSQMGDPNYNPLADLDYDGDVDRYDAGIFAQNFGKSIPY